MWVVGSSYAEHYKDLSYKKMNAFCKLEGIKFTLQCSLLIDNIDATMPLFNIH